MCEKSSGHQAHLRSPLKGPQLHGYEEGLGGPLGTPAPESAPLTSRDRPSAQSKGGIPLAPPRLSLILCLVKPSSFGPRLELSTPGPSHRPHEPQVPIAQDKAQPSLEVTHLALKERWM